MDEIREVTVRLISSFTVIYVLYSNLHTSGMLNVLFPCVNTHPYENKTFCLEKALLIYYVYICIYCTVIILYASKATEKSIIWLN